MKFNISDYIICELTEYGMDQIKRRGFTPEIIKGNLIKIQLWELMHEIGDSLFNGADQIIVDNIINLPKCDQDHSN